MNDILKRTTDAYNQFSQLYIRKHSSLGETKEQLEEFARCVQHGVILDVGCAQGRDLRFFLSQGFQPVGIDLSFKLLHAWSVGQLERLLMDMRFIGFRPEVLDGLWVCASFLHIPKSEANRVLREFHRVLKANCPIYLSVQEGTGENLIEREPSFVRFFADYSLDEVKVLFSENGFNVTTSGLETKRNITWLGVFAKKAGFER